MKLTPIAVCRTRASPGPGTGSGTSSNRSSSGPPSWWTTIAFGMAANIAPPAPTGTSVRRPGLAERHADFEGLVVGEVGADDLDVKRAVRHLPTKRIAQDRRPMRGARDEVRRRPAVAVNADAGQITNHE